MKELLEYIYKEQKELSTFSGIGALLGWDHMTYMPMEGNNERSEQISLISRLAHEKFTDDKLYENVKKLNQKYNLEKLQKNDRAVVKRLEKDIEKSRKVPSEFVERMSKATTLAYTSWQKAKKTNNFSIFSNHLEKIIDLEKEYCTFINLPGSLYNNLLDDYEEGMTVEKLDFEFNYLKSKLKKILEKILSSKFYQNQKPLDKKFSETKQKKICDKILRILDFPDKRSRIDISTHPFTTSMGNYDVRITTNYERKNPLFSFFSTVHEAGHAFYELGLPKKEYIDTVISDSPSLGLHESQSRFWENMIARNKHFWKFFYPKFQKIASGQLDDISIDKWYLYVNQVKPSLIRVEADELTYCLHVILRYEIEKDLIEEKISVSELPEVWNEKMDNMLGIRPKKDSEGVLQDMHWSGGNFGYFPTYAIGTIYASQLFKKLSEDYSNIHLEIEKGSFNIILKWLNKNVHRYGRLFMADEIIKKTCGKGLNSKVFVSYLKDKYYDLYEV